MHTLFRYVYEKLTALTHWVFNLEGARNKEIVTTYHATPHSIGYVTHDKFINSPNASLNPGV